MLEDSTDALKCTNGKLGSPFRMVKYLWLLLFSKEVSED